MQGFCNDLLDLRKLKDGMFHLVNEVFDPTQIFDLVCSIFSPQADAKGVQISWQLYDPVNREESSSQSLEFMRSNGEAWPFGRLRLSNEMPMMLGD